MNSMEKMLFNANQELLRQKEEYLLRFFGSIENAEKRAHLFVLEEKITSSVDSFDIEFDVNTMQIHTELRIRHKTPEELSKDRADKIIDSHTRPRCIVCGDPILEEEPIAITIHGDYHAPPRRCLEGKS